jgi:hypothetical protein
MSRYPLSAPACPLTPHAMWSQHALGARLPDTEHAIDVVVRSLELSLPTRLRCTGGASELAFTATPGGVLLGPDRGMTASGGDRARRAVRPL